MSAAAWAWATSAARRCWCEAYQTVNHSRPIVAVVVRMKASRPAAAHSPWIRGSNGRQPARPATTPPGRSCRRRPTATSASSKAAPAVADVADSAPAPNRGRRASAPRTPWSRPWCGRTLRRGAGRVAPTRTAAPVRRTQRAARRRRSKRTAQVESQPTDSTPAAMKLATSSDSGAGRPWYGKVSSGERHSASAPSRPGTITWVRCSKANSPQSRRVASESPFAVRRAHVRSGETSRRNSAVARTAAISGSQPRDMYPRLAASSTSRPVAASSTRRRRSPWPPETDVTTVTGGAGDHLPR